MTSAVGLAVKSSLPFKCRHHAVNSSKEILRLKQHSHQSDVSPSSLATSRKSNLVIILLLVAAVIIQIARPQVSITTSNKKSLTVSFTDREQVVK